MIFSQYFHNIFAIFLWYFHVIFILNVEWKAKVRLNSTSVSKGLTSLMLFVNDEQLWICYLFHVFLHCNCIWINLYLCLTANEGRIPWWAERARRRSVLESIILHSFAFRLPLNWFTMARDIPSYILWQSASPRKEFLELLSLRKMRELVLSMVTGRHELVIRGHWQTDSNIPNSRRRRLPNHCYISVLPHLHLTQQSL